MGLDHPVFSTEPLRSTTTSAETADTLALQHTTTAGALQSRALHQPPAVAWRLGHPHPLGVCRGDLWWTLGSVATPCNTALTCENDVNVLVSATQYYSKNLGDYC
jgi:hypothetical protein